MPICCGLLFSVLEACGQYREGEGFQGIVPTLFTHKSWVPVGFPYMPLKVEFNKPFVFLAKNFTFLLLPWVH